MEKFYLAALAQHFTYRSGKAVEELIRVHGSAQKAHEAGPRGIEAIHPSEKLKTAYQAMYDKSLPQAIQRYSAEHNIALVTKEEATYPHLLKEVYNPPLVLYVKGNPLSSGKALAIVGSRKATYYGLEVAKSFAKTIARDNITIVSGGAYGIDVAAHEGALAVGGSTIVVLGGGFSNLYPASHKRLFHQVLAKGSLVTEYAPWEEPLPRNFPQRNRIIVGLCSGVLVVEGALKSGAMITASLAVSENRELYVVPGNINSPTSKGTNGLIKDGAHVVDSPEDILLDYLSPQHNYLGQAQIDLFEPELEHCTDEEKSIFQLIAKTDLITLEDIIVKLDLTMSQVSVILLELQLKGKIMREANNRYRVIRGGAL